MNTLKYGENPHQKGTISIDAASSDPLGLGRFKMVDGRPMTEGAKLMSWVTVTDLDRGLDAISKLAAVCEANLGEVPCIAILLEHGNACGAAIGSSEQVINNAIYGNFRASMGAFLVTNVAITEPVAFKMRQWMAANRPFSGIAAPEIDPAGATYFERKKGVCHMLVNPALAKLGQASLQRGDISHTVRGATITQSPNLFVPTFPAEWDRQLKTDMCVAWAICAASNSNSISIANDGTLVANAVGHPDRAAACESAIMQARQAKHTDLLKGAAAASDSFFTFADGVDSLARRKIKALYATSGSLHDAEIAEHARQFDMIFHTVPDTQGRIFNGH